MTASKICPQCGTAYDGEVRFCPRDGATLKSTNAGDLIGSVIADRYHVVKKLGEGGMGQVYLAQHVKMGRKSAVKVMHPAMVHDADAISRFNREAANAAQISHPNVAAIYDFGETSEGLIYLAMEFVEGEPLTALISREGALPPARAAGIVRQVGDALAAAHDLGIVHRDLKPDNIMIARTRAGRDLVKVVDFGIAKAQGNEGQNVTKTGLVVGTLEYMSPEQLTGSPLDGRSDLYSLAIVAFNALTGRLPFPANSAQESMIMRLTDAPKQLAEMRPDLEFPPELQAVVNRGLERDAEARYATTVEFGMEFERAALAGQPPALGARPSAAVATSAMNASPKAAATPPASLGAVAPAGSTVPKTAAGAAPAAHEPVSPTRPSVAATPRTRSTMPLAVAATVLLAAGAGGAWFALSNRGGGDGVPAGASTSVVPSGQTTDSMVTYSKAEGADPAADPAPIDSGAEARADLERYERLLEEARLTPSDARETAGALRNLMARLRSADDSIRAGMTLALALESAEDTPALCVVVRRLIADERLSEAKRVVLTDLRREHCAQTPRRSSAPAY